MQASHDLARERRRAGDGYDQDMEMTLAQMKADFESEWILIGAPKTDEALNIRGGTLLHHSKDRDEVYRKAISLRPARAAVLYTGAIPEGTAIVL